MGSNEDRRLMMVIRLCHRVVQLQECGLLHCVMIISGSSFQVFGMWALRFSVVECRGDLDHRPQGFSVHGGIVYRPPSFFGDRKAL